MESVTETILDPAVVAKTGAVFVVIVRGVISAKLPLVKTFNEDSAPIPRWLMAFKSDHAFNARILDPIAELKYATHPPSF